MAWKAAAPALLFCLSLTFLPPPVLAEGGFPPAFIAIIIDDLGERHDDGLRATRLPGEITCSILPHVAWTELMARECRQRDREIMLHMPMEATEARNPGPGALYADMDRPTVIRALRSALAAVPDARGVNNHMGSRFTRDPLRMGWVMHELVQTGDLYFIDSRTNHETVAAMRAAEYQLPHASRHVFLDHDPDPTAVEAQFRELLLHAFRNGTAIGIGHPYPSTLELLERMLPRLELINVHLVSVSNLLALKAEQQRSPQQWQASWSPSQRAVKSSKQ